MLVPHALPCDWSGCTLATRAVAEWFNRECLPKFVNELAPPTLQTFDTSVRRVKGKVAPTLVSFGFALLMILGGLTCQCHSCAHTSNLSFVSPLHSTTKDLTTAIVGVQHSKFYHRRSLPSCKSEAP